MRAPWSTDWPTPPHPITVTVDPGRICAVLSAAPTPVVTPHPMSASCSAGRSLSTFTSIDSSTVISSAKVPSPLIPITLLPSARVPLDTIECAPICSHSCDWSRRQKKQLPHAGTKDAITRSPLPTRLTSLPTASTVPAPSCPRMAGGGSGTLPLAMLRSEWQTPLASMCTRTSRGPIAAAAPSSTTIGSLYPVRIAALMVPPRRRCSSDSRAGCRNRTDDIFFTREVLYQLS